jgi:hypothetical protein
MKTLSPESWPKMLEFFEENPVYVLRLRTDRATGELENGYPVVDHISKLSKANASVFLEMKRFFDLRGEQKPVWQAHIYVVVPRALKFDHRTPEGLLVIYRGNGTILKKQIALDPTLDLSSELDSFCRLATGFIWTRCMEEEPHA